MTEADLIAALSQRYAAPTWAFLSHVRNGTGYSRSTVRTADALAMGLWPSRGLELHGFEVKVSRSDWLRELKTAEKAEEIARYCHRWWVVVSDPDIVREDELPPGWGLLAMVDRKLTVRVDAPRSDAAPPDHAMLAAILRRATEGMVPRAAVEELAAQLADGRIEKLRRDHQSELSLLRLQHKRLADEVAAFEAASGVQITRWNAGTVGAAVRLVLAGYLAHRRGDFAGVAARLERLAGELREAIAELDATTTELEGRDHDASGTN